VILIAEYIGRRPEPAWEQMLDVLEENPFVQRWKRRLDGAVKVTGLWDGEPFDKGIYKSA
jgi:hypothetical protein